MFGTLFKETKQMIKEKALLKRKTAMKLHEKFTIKIGWRRKGIYLRVLAKKRVHKNQDK